ncbi:MAG: hypothetical protein ACREQY_24485, partial [Candidatus Binatia bacterium]
HKAIERQLVDARIDRYAERLRRRVEPVRAERLTTDRVFDLLLESHSKIPPLLRADRDARRAGTPGSAAYLDALDRSVGELLSGQIAAAVGALGSLWLSAWDEAGRPTPTVHGERSSGRPGN